MRLAPMSINYFLKDIRFFQKRKSVMTKYKNI